MRREPTPHGCTRGKPAELAADAALDLIEPRTFGSRVIYERYGRARPGVRDDDSPPSR